ncbi:MAG: efflux RND transporter periplasmic adaptor subunit [Parvularculaceae bacterium]|nr:efflux RND transporter periplasmic adaptor subunit [Parvularculaceae bacterium]
MLKLMKSVGRGVVWLGAAVVIVAAAGFGGRTLLAKADQPLTNQPAPVAVLEVRYQDTYQEQRLFPGRVSPAQVADLAFQLGGEVDEVLVDIGDRVTKGQALAKLDPVRITLRRQEVRAQLAEAEALAKRAAQTKARVEDLVAQGFATAQELDNAVADAQAAAQRVTALKRSLARLSEDVADATLTAPFEGYVVERYVDGGTTVANGQRILRLNERAAFEAEVGIPTSIADTYLPGDEVTLQAGDEIVQATVAGVGENVDVLTRTQTVRLRIANTSAVVPGSLVRLVTSTERTGKGVWVPYSSLQEGYRGLWAVYVVETVDGQDEIRRKDVEIISLADDRAFVSGTLEDGDRLVVTSPFRFVPGQQVEGVKDAPAGTSLAAISSPVVR